MQATRFPTRASGVADRMSGFIAHLRMNGLKLGPAETQAVLQTLTHVNPLDPEQVRLSSKVLLCPDSEIWARYDDLFDAWWFNTGKQKSGQVKTSHLRSQYTNRPSIWSEPEADDSDQKADEGSADDQREPDDPDGETSASGSEGRLIATRTTNLTKRDLRELMDEDTLKSAERIAERLAKALRDKRSRRFRMAARGRRIDLRRTMRASLARGGEPIDLKRRRRPDRPFRIVTLCDVSGSMTVYSRVFLAFVKGLISADTQADAYLFHTRLMRVTPVLRDHDTLRAAGRLSLMAEGFGGGTDIAGSLTQFCDTYAAGAVNGRTVVIILSDGYCTAGADQLGETLAKLRRKAGRIVWLNPLAGWRDYEPVAAGMQAAMPHLDALLPANTIASLAALEEEFRHL